MELGTFQQAIQKLGNKVLMAPTKGRKLRIIVGEQVIKSWKKGFPADQL
jgi:hypothetical protein